MILKKLIKLENQPIIYYLNSNFSNKLNQFKLLKNQVNNEIYLP